MALAELLIPTQSGTYDLKLIAGRSTILLGANGSGKTRLGVKVEQLLNPAVVRRIAAHRSLTMSDRIQSMALERALRALASGHPDEGGVAQAHRWQQKPAIALLSDYDYLLQALFAEQSRTAVEHLEQHRSDPERQPPTTVLSRLKVIWERLLPHRRLRLLELAIEVRPPQIADGSGYPGSEMSDGERVIFYLLGHCLMAPPNSVIIVDEPELHIHKAILGKLWDSIESERPDCSFLYITHDLDFVVARPTAAKLVVRSFTPEGRWEIEALPSGINLPDRVVSELVGARQPVLFVEGERGSLDATIYRWVYPDFLIQPIGSCDAVVHAVASFRKNELLHRLGSVSGCVDADARECQEITKLKEYGVYVLPIAEVENALLLPNVYRQLGIAMDFKRDDVENHLRRLTQDILAQASSDLELASVRYAVRRLDAELKKLAPAARTVGDLCERFQSAIMTVKPNEIAKSYQTKLEAAIERQNLEETLALYDNKGLLSMAARHLGFNGREEITEYAARLLGGKRGEDLLTALKAELPLIPIHPDENMHAAWRAVSGAEGSFHSC